MNDTRLNQDEWDSLPEYQKERILKGIEEADAGLGISAKEVIQTVCEKYGLNKPKDWWDEINADEIAEIEEGLAQADRGETTPHEEVMAKYDKFRDQQSKSK